MNLHLTSNRQVIRSKFRYLFLLLIFSLTIGGISQLTFTQSEEELAKQLANSVASLINMTLQLNNSQRMKVLGVEK